jgi:hypothetical protein
MISKCANPDCRQSFDYRLGRVIRFHNDEYLEGQVMPCIRHFWLCETCSRTHLLECHDGMGVVIKLRCGSSPEEQGPRVVCDCAHGRWRTCCLG